MHSIQKVMCFQKLGIIPKKEKIGLDVAATCLQVHNFGIIVLPDSCCQLAPSLSRVFYVFLIDLVFINNGVV